MMRRVLLFLFTYACMFSTPAAGETVVTVQSVPIPLYEEAVRGFFEVCGPSAARIYLTDLKTHSSLARNIGRVSPDLILAVGMDALDALAFVREVPVVFVMVPAGWFRDGPGANVTGVYMQPGVEAVMAHVTRLLPLARRIGMVAGPDLADIVVRNAAGRPCRDQAALVAESVRRARDVPSALLALRNRIDVLWMVPDASLLTSATMEFFIMFSLENKIPLVTFSEKYLAMGALMALDPDPVDMGRQAGEMARLILSGRQVAQEPPRTARKLQMTVNATVAEKFGIPLEDNLSTEALIVK